jgi:hypothetical protein
VREWPVTLTSGRRLAQGGEREERGREACTVLERDFDQWGGPSLTTNQSREYFWRSLQPPIKGRGSNLLHTLTSKSGVSPANERRGFEDVNESTKNVGGGHYGIKLIRFPKK